LRATGRSLSIWRAEKTRAIPPRPISDSSTKEPSLRPQTMAASYRRAYRSDKRPWADSLIPQTARIPRSISPIHWGVGLELGTTLPCSALLPPVLLWLLPRLDDPRPAREALNATESRQKPPRAHFQGARRWLSLCRSRSHQTTSLPRIFPTLRRTCVHRPSPSERSR